MESNFDIAKAIGNCDKNGICVLNGLHIQDKQPHFKQSSNDNLSRLLDEIGSMSAKAQELKSVITTGIKFFGLDQRIYLKCDGNKFIGFIKVGKKKLFIYDEIGCINELNLLCVLDFYVYEGCQRTGFGKELFMKMVECEKVEPRKMGYDRPSSKLLSFLKKHFNLTEYVPQNNSFVVFNDYFKPSSVINKNKQFEAQTNVLFNKVGFGQNQTQVQVQTQPKTFHQFKKDIHESNSLRKIEKPNIDQCYEINNKTNSDSNSNQDYIKQITLPYNYQYTSSSSEYGAFLNVNPKQNYHYYYK